MFRAKHDPGVSADRSVVCSLLPVCSPLHCGSAVQDAPDVPDVLLPVYSLLPVCSLLHCEPAVQDAPDVPDVLLPVCSLMQACLPLRCGSAVQDAGVSHPLDALHEPDALPAAPDETDAEPGGFPGSGCCS